MKIIGLTGGIASGKNFVAKIFQEKGAMIFDADKETHKLLESDKSTIEEVKKNFPESFIDGKINRKVLAKIVFAKNSESSQKLKILEEIIHPRVRKECRKFLKSARAKSVKLAVLNIPLLLESKGYKCDKIIAIIAPKILQKQRFLSRETKSFENTKHLPKNFSERVRELEEKFERIRLHQMSNSERKTLVDFVIYNHGAASLRTQVRKVIAKMSTKSVICL